MNQRQCSSPAIAIFGQEPSASTLCGCDVFAPVARQRSTPVSSRKTSRKSAAYLLPHENEALKIYLHLFRLTLKNVPGMKPKANDARSFSLKKQTEQRSEFVHQVTRLRPVRRSRKGNFHSTPDESRSKKSSSIRGILSLAGQSSPGSTRNALARHSSSKSETHRNCVSILARVWRLKSHPHRRQRAASIGCVSFCWSRNRRICGPTRFRGFFFMFQLQNWNDRKCAISKGSEFRTFISLANEKAFLDFRFDGNFSLCQMNRFFNEPDVNNRNVTHPPFARLENDQH